MKTNLTLTLAAAAMMSPLAAQGPLACRADVWNNGDAIVTELAALPADGARAAVDTLSAKIEEMLPGLNTNSQRAAEKLLLDLEQALSESGAEGAALAPAERLALANDFMQVLIAAGTAHDDSRKLFGALADALGELDGQGQIRSALSGLIANARTCRL